MPATRKSKAKATATLESTTDSPLLATTPVVDSKVKATHVTHLSTETSQNSNSTATTPNTVATTNGQDMSDLVELAFNELVKVSRRKRL